MARVRMRSWEMYDVYERWQREDVCVCVCVLMIREQSTVVFHPERLKVENSLNSVSGRLPSRVTLS